MHAREANEREGLEPSVEAQKESFYAGMIGARALRMTAGRSEESPASEQLLAAVLCRQGPGAGGIRYVVADELSARVDVTANAKGGGDGEASLARAPRLSCLLRSSFEVLGREEDRSGAVRLQRMCLSGDLARFRLDHAAGGG